MRKREWFVCVFFGVVVIVVFLFLLLCFVPTLLLLLLLLWLLVVAVLLATALLRFLSRACFVLCDSQEPHTNGGGMRDRAIGIGGKESARETEDVHVNMMKCHVRGGSRWVGEPCLLTSSVPYSRLGVQPLLRTTAGRLLSLPLCLSSPLCYESILCLALPACPVLQSISLLSIMPTLTSYLPLLQQQQQQHTHVLHHK